MKFLIFPKCLIDLVGHTWKLGRNAFIRLLASLYCRSAHQLHDGEWLKLVKRAGMETGKPNFAVCTPKGQRPQVLWVPREPRVGEPRREQRPRRDGAAASRSMPSRLAQLPVPALAALPLLCTRRRSVRGARVCLGRSGKLNPILHSFHEERHGRVKAR